MIDRYGRTMEYLRISLTDKCNLRCRYCMPPEGVPLMPHDQVLRLEEVQRIVKVMAGLGIKKVRFTGGEPLVRRNIEQLIREVAALPGIEKVAITTNGVLLKRMLPALHEAGLGAVNISLDTLNRERFRQITGADVLEQVQQGLEAALDAGMRVKINCVPVREFNEEELEWLAGLAKDRPLDVRFIELMPIGCGRDFHGIPSREILSRLEEAYGKADVITKEREEKGDRSSPAVYCNFTGFKGRVGFISPMSHKFCQYCDRLRLTPEGFLKSCLYFPIGVDLKEILRRGGSDRELEEAVLKAVNDKPREHNFRNREDEDKRFMSQIGG